MYKEGHIKIRFPEQWGLRLLIISNLQHYRSNISRVGRVTRQLNPGPQLVSCLSFEFRLQIRLFKKEIMIFFFFINIMDKVNESLFL